MRHLAVFFLLLVLLSAARPPETGVTLLVRVWDVHGAPVPEATVTARVPHGTVAAAPAGRGGHLLVDAGTSGSAGYKVLLEVSRPPSGPTLVALLLVPDTFLVVDVVYDGLGALAAFSPSLVPPTSHASAVGTAPNDDCAGAIAVEVPSVTLGSTSPASNDGQGCGTFNDSRDVWYSVVGTGNTMTASLCLNVTFDTKLSVFCGSCEELLCVGGIDNWCGLGSEVSWCSEEGASYLILVHGFKGDHGDFTLAVAGDGVPCEASTFCLAPPTTGACCLPDGSCNALVPAECEALGGTHQGDGTTCFDLPGAAVSHPVVAGIAIPNDGSPVGAVSTLTIPDSFVVGDVDVCLDVEHTWVGELSVTLTHGGTTVLLVDKQALPSMPGGCREDDWLGACLDDEGTGGWFETQCTPGLSSPPSYVPNNPLSAFDGMDAAGDWVLEASDGFPNSQSGTLVGWTLVLTEGGASLCSAECFLVIGDEPGQDPFVGAGHGFQTLVGDIQESHVVLMDSLPEFVLPAPHVRSPWPAAGLGGVGAAQVDTEGSPAWMQDGRFAVQVLLWNPAVFPGLPEQFTAGLLVELGPSGSVTSRPYGDSQGGLTLTHEVFLDTAGRRVIRFPFVIPGF